MKKIDNIHIGKHSFFFEEDASEKLEKYIEKIKLLYKDNGEDLKVAEVENRVAETCFDCVGEGGIVTSSIIDEAISRIGIKIEEEPQETSPKKEENKTADEASSPWYKAMQQGRKLFRNPHNCYLGGVLSGLSAYLGISTALLRIIVFFTAVIVDIAFYPILIAYLLLWAIVPKAQSIIDFTRMRKVKTTGSEEEIKNRWKANYEETIERLGNTNNSGCLPTLVRGLFFILMAIITIPLIIVLMILIIVPLFWGELFFGSLGIPFMACVGIISFFAISIFAIIHWIMRKNKKWNPMTKAAKITLVLLWMATLIFAIISVRNAVNDDNGAKIKEFIKTGFTAPFKAIKNMNLEEFLSYAGTVQTSNGIFYAENPIENNSDCVWGAIWKKEPQQCKIPFIIESIHTGDNNYDIYFYEPGKNEQEDINKIKNKEFVACYSLTLKEGEYINGPISFMWDSISNTIYLNELNFQYSAITGINILENSDNGRARMRQECDTTISEADKKRFIAFTIFYYGNQRTPDMNVEDSSALAGLHIKPYSTFTRLKNTTHKEKATYYKEDGNKDSAYVMKKFEINKDHINDCMEKVNDAGKEFAKMAESANKMLNKSLHVTHEVVQNK